MNEYQQFAKKVTELVCDLAEGRKSNSEFVLDPDEEHRITQPAWVLAEREAVTDFINYHRTKRGFSEVTTKDVLNKVERSAWGHIDYSQKLGYGAANMILAEKI